MRALWRLVNLIAIISAISFMGVNELTMLFWASFILPIFFLVIFGVVIYILFSARVLLVNNANDFIWLRLLCLIPPGFFLLLQIDQYKIGTKLAIIAMFSSFLLELTNAFSHYKQRDHINEYHTRVPIPLIALLLLFFTLPLVTPSGMGFVTYLTTPIRQAQSAALRERLVRDTATFNTLVQFDAHSCRDLLVPSLLHDGVFDILIQINITVSKPNDYTFVAKALPLINVSDDSSFGKRSFEPGVHQLTYRLSAIGRQYEAGREGQEARFIRFIDQTRPFTLFVELSEVGTINGQEFTFRDRIISESYGLINSSTTSIECTTKPYTLEELGVTNFPSKL